MLWTGDDAIEIDFSSRNVRVFENRISNCGMGVSLQPVWDGQNYVFRNVIANAAQRRRRRRASRCSSAYRPCRDAVVNRRGETFV